MSSRRSGRSVKRPRSLLEETGNAAVIQRKQRRKKARKATLKPTHKEASKEPAHAADTAAPARTKSRRAIRVPADEDEPVRMYSLIDPGEDDGELCRICLRGHSSPGNLIVFCDGCDMAVHQLCYRNFAHGMVQIGNSTASPDNSVRPMAPPPVSPFYPQQVEPPPAPTPNAMQPILYPRGAPAIARAHAALAIWGTELDTTDWYCLRCAPQATEQKLKPEHTAEDAEAEGGSSAHGIASDEEAVPGFDKGIGVSESLVTRENATTEEHSDVGASPVASASASAGAGADIDIDIGAGAAVDMTHDSAGLADAVRELRCAEDMVVLLSFLTSFQTMRARQPRPRRPHGECALEQDGDDDGDKDSNISDGDDDDNGIMPALPPSTSIARLPELWPEELELALAMHTHACTDSGARVCGGGDPEQTHTHGADAGGNAAALLCVALLESLAEAEGESAVTPGQYAGDGMSSGLHGCALMASFSRRAQATSLTSEADAGDWIEQVDDECAAAMLACVRGEYDPGLCNIGAKGGMASVSSEHESVGGGGNGSKVDDDGEGDASATLFLALRPRLRLRVLRRLCEWLLAARASSAAKIQPDPSLCPPVVAPPPDAAGVLSSDPAGAHMPLTLPPALLHGSSGTVEAAGGRGASKPKAKSKNKAQLPGSSARVNKGSGDGSSSSVGPNLRHHLDLCRWYCDGGAEFSRVCDLGADSQLRSHAIVCVGRPPRMRLYRECRHPWSGECVDTTARRVESDNETDEEDENEGKCGDILGFDPLRQPSPVNLTDASTVDDCDEGVDDHNSDDAASDTAMHCADRPREQTRSFSHSGHIILTGRTALQEELGSTNGCTIITGATVVPGTKTDDRWDLLCRGRRQIMQFAHTLSRRASATPELRLLSRLQAALCMLKANNAALTKRARQRAAARADRAAAARAHAAKMERIVATSRRSGIDISNIIDSDPSDSDDNNASDDSGGVAAYWAGSHVSGQRSARDKQRACSKRSRRARKAVDYTFSAVDDLIDQSLRPEEKQRRYGTRTRERGYDSRAADSVSDTGTTGRRSCRSRRGRSLRGQRRGRRDWDENENEEDGEWRESGSSDEGSDDIEDDDDYEGRGTRRKSTDRRVPIVIDRDSRTKLRDCTKLMQCFAFGDGAIATVAPPENIDTAAAATSADADSNADVDADTMTTPLVLGLAPSLVRKCDVRLLRAAIATATPQDASVAPVTPAHAATSSIVLNPPHSCKAAPLTVSELVMLSKLDCGPFLEPVDWQALGLADYRKVVRRPMDLGTVYERLRGGQHYTSPKDFLRDVRRVWSNAMLYNARDSPIYAQAAALEALFELAYASLLSTWSLNAAGVASSGRSERGGSELVGASVETARAHATHVAHMAELRWISRARIGGTCEALICALCSGEGLGAEPTEEVETDEEEEIIVDDDDGSDRLAGEWGGSEVNHARTRARVRVTRTVSWWPSGGWAAVVQPFLAPVDWKGLGLRNYLKVIRKPMDLGTVRQRLEGAQYSSPAKLAADVRLTFDNAMLYNEEESHVAKAAQALLGVFNSRWAQLEADWAADEAKFAPQLALALPAEPPAKGLSTEVHTKIEDDAHGQKVPDTVDTIEGHQHESQAMTNCVTTSSECASAPPDIKLAEPVDVADEEWRCDHPWVGRGVRRLQPAVADGQAAQWLDGRIVSWVPHGKAADDWALWRAAFVKPGTDACRRTSGDQEDDPEAHNRVQEDLEVHEAREAMLMWRIRHGTKVALIPLTDLEKVEMDRKASSTTEIEAEANKTVQDAATVTASVKVEADPMSSGEMQARTETGVAETANSMAEPVVEEAAKAVALRPAATMEETQGADLTEDQQARSRAQAQERVQMRTLELGNEEKFKQQEEENDLRPNQTLVQGHACAQVQEDKTLQMQKQVQNQPHSIDDTSQLQDCPPPVASKEAEFGADMPMHAPASPSLVRLPSTTACGHEHSPRCSLQIAYEESHDQGHRQ